MCAEMSVDSKIYPGADGQMSSMTNMLSYFEKHGAMRVSDLHIKVGAQPVYRIDGDLVKINGRVVTEEIAKGLIYPLIGDKCVQTLKEKSSVDSSYRFGKLQFRINVFMENDGVCAAIRALGLDIPPPGDVGFPNDVWKDIIRRHYKATVRAGAVYGHHGGR